MAGPVSSRSSDLILNKRQFETTLTVGDGQIMAFGGLLNDDERRTIERIPLLSDIPLIGELFKSKSKTRAKTNLMVFIRPTILRTRNDADVLTARRYDYVRSMQLERNPDIEPSIDQLVRDYMGAIPPTTDQLLQGDYQASPLADTSPAKPADIMPVDVPASDKMGGGAS